MSDVQRDIEDNYTEYLDDELGYAWGVWDRLTGKEISAHDEILHASPHKTDSIDPAGLNDLDRLAYMHACRRSGDGDGVVAALRLVLSEPMEHTGVDYPEVFERFITELSRRQEFDEARHALERLQSSDWEWSRTPYLAALLAAREDRTSAVEAFRGLLDDAPDDPELRYDVAEDLWELGEREVARAILEEAAEVARQTGDDAVLVDIAVLRASWIEEKATGDGEDLTDAPDSTE